MITDKEWYIENIVMIIIKHLRFTSELISALNKL